MKRYPQARTSNASAAKNAVEASQGKYKGYFPELAEKHPKELRRKFYLGFELYLHAANDTKMEMANDPMAKALRAVFGVLTEVRPWEMFQYTHHVLLAVLQDPKMEKVARCQVCGKFYVRARKDQKCCGPHCAHALRVRRWRGKYPEVYKARRIRQAESTKGGK